MRYKIQIKLSLFVLVLFILSFGSCQYEPSDNFYRNVNQQVPDPTLSVEGLIPLGNTINLGIDTVLTFNFTCTNNIYKIMLFVDDNSTSLTFDAENRSGDGYRRGPTKGLHMITLDVYSESGTGSIADKLYEEGHKFSMTRYVYVKSTIESTYYATFNKEKASLEWTVSRYGE
jgi:hypothetical protein